MCHQEKLCTLGIINCVAFHVQHAMRDMFGTWLTPEIRLSKGVLNGHEKAYKRNKLYKHDSINCKTDTNVVKNMA